jgi:hypothetical protein
MTPINPSFKNSSVEPRIVSLPNHVANKAAEDIKKGSFLPATAKSEAFFIFREARYPIKTVSNKYTDTERASMLLNT